MPVVILVGAAAYLTAIGDMLWLAGVLAGVVLVAVSVALGGYRLLVRDALRGFREMQDPSVAFTLDDSGLSARSDLGESRVKWDAFVKLWRFREAWLLFLSTGVYVTLPTDTLTDAARELIIRSMEKAGKQVA